MKTPLTRRKFLGSSTLAGAAITIGLRRDVTGEQLPRIGAPGSDKPALLGDKAKG